MAYYVILNFEDPDPNPLSAPNRILSRHLAPSGAATASALATVGRYENREGFHREINPSQGGEVVLYPCQELIARDRNGTLRRGDADIIRRDCEEAKTIAVVLQGELTDTERGFAIDGNPVCTWEELGRLMLLLLPDTRSYNIALIMCYGARSSDTGLDHRGLIPEDKLKTSFAYKFFRRICQLRHVRMTARTGKVTSSVYRHEVETEDSVLRFHARMMAIHRRGVTKADMD